MPPSYIPLNPRSTPVVLDMGATPPLRFVILPNESTLLRPLSVLSEFFFGVRGGGLGVIWESHRAGMGGWAVLLAQRGARGEYMGDERDEWGM